MSFLNYSEELFANLREENNARRRADARDITFMEEAEADNAIDAAEERLKVASVDLQAKSNALKCNCEKFELVTRKDGRSVIIRRGATLTLDITLNIPTDLKTNYNLGLTFSFGPRPNGPQGTEATLWVTNKQTFDADTTQWDVRLVTQTGNTLTLEVHVPVHVMVGIWKISVQVSNHGDGAAPHVYRPEETMYILFNPWNKDDDVYMPEDVLRDEYVLNDIGKIWVGNWNWNVGRAWNYGQFDDAVLPACVFLLEYAGLRPEDRGDVVSVSRAITRMVNVHDENGVLWGGWDGNYQDGKEPGHWTGSIAILEQYMTRGPVKYGQCWVFAGVVTTVCRALGIPCRPVTNLNSAHDNNMSLTIDYFYHEDLRELDSQEARNTRFGGDNLKDWFGDSIWNFHVWNDAWMVRRDLPDGFGGWQAIDATPLKPIGEIQQCGPASHTAIKRGRTELNYDVNFLMGEVNADVINWIKAPNEKLGFKKYSTDIEHVGRELIIKAPGYNLPGDQDKQLINDLYKEPEGTERNRLMLATAARNHRTARIAFGFNEDGTRFPEPDESIKDVEFTIQDIGQVSIGEDFSVTVTAKNVSDETRTMLMKICSASEYYNGVRGNRIKWVDSNVTLEAGQEDNLTMHVTYTEYFDKLVEYGMIDVFSVCHVKETNQDWFKQDALQVKKPMIDVDLPSTATVGKSMIVKLSFTNPLDIDLTRCSIVVDGPGLTRPKTFPLKDVVAKGEMRYELKVYPKRGGRRTIIASFNSRELVDLTGSQNVDVIEA